MQNTPLHPGIDYEHRISNRARRLTLRVGADGKILVTTPRFTPKFAIKKFISSHLDWIKAEQKKNLTKPRPVTDKEVQIFGKKYQKILDYSSDRAIGVSIRDDKLYLNPTSEKKTWGKSEDKLLNNYLKHSAERYILTRLTQLSKKMGITYNAITLREQKTRWGSCSSKGNLNFNWRLVHYEPEIIDYVIIHELSHREQMNHSVRFWQLVAKYDPAYKKHRGFLKRQGAAVG